MTHHAADFSLDLAAELLYRWLSALLAPPGTSTLCIQGPDNQRLAAQAADVLRETFAEAPIPLGFGELPIEHLNVRPVLAAVSADPDRLAAEHQRTFGFIMCRECPPYETEYHTVEDTFFRSQQMADVAGFYRAFGLDVGRGLRERPDHIALELEFLALLLLKKRLAVVAGGGDTAVVEQAAVCDAARASFFRDHLSWWAPSFAVALRRKAEKGLYAAVGELLAAFVPIERTRLGIAPPGVPHEPRSCEPTEECQGCLVQLSA